MMDYPGIGWKNKPFFIRLFHWEYWPSRYVYFPLYIYYVWLTIKARSPWFWSASNPGIETGGMLGESKIKIYQIIPDAYKPVTLYVHTGTSVHAALEIMKEHGLSFPIICKPDRGERGFQVSKIKNEEELALYIEKNKVDYIMQAYCHYPVELGVYYCRYPWEKTGRVFSVVGKEFLHVTGDGKSTLRELISMSQRALLQWEKLRIKFADDMNTIVPKGDKWELEPIGNHARGTRFINLNGEIDTALNEAFDHITAQIPGVFFCRYDLRTTSIEDVKKGKNIAIVELNGVGAEPAHIYDPDYKLRHAWGDLIRQYKMVYKISVYHHKQGVKYMTTREVREHLKMIKAYRTLAES